MPEEKLDPEEVIMNQEQNAAVLRKNHPDYAAAPSVEEEMLNPVQEPQYLTANEKEAYGESGKSGSHSAKKK